MYPNGMTKPIRVNTPSDWKVAMHRQLDSHGMSRYAFVRKVREADVCTAHTAECLLADEGTMTGNRVPSFATAIQMAKLAGFDMVLIPKKAP